MKERKYKYDKCPNCGKFVDGLGITRLASGIHEHVETSYADKLPPFEYGDVVVAYCNEKCSTQMREKFIASQNDL